MKQYARRVDRFCPMALAHRQDRLATNIDGRRTLTLEEFGERFGLSPNDLAKITDWLASHGFQIDSVVRSRTYITFSATAGQVRDTFKTELHRYRADGDTSLAVRECAPASGVGVLL